MAQTVIGVFATSAAAHTAEERLVGRGIAPSALHVAAQDGTGTREPEEVREGGMPAGIRDFLAELFGTEHSEEVGHYSEALRQGGVVLAVEVPAGTPLEPVRETLLAAGAVDVNERAESAFRYTEGGAAYQRPYEDYEPDYRKDFQIRYAGGGGTYDDYAPAYRYGHTLAGDPRYQGRDWAGIESEAQRDWESQHPESTWERFKLAIQHGWERVTGSR